MHTARPPQVNFSALLMPNGKAKVSSGAGWDVDKCLVIAAIIVVVAAQSPRLLCVEAREGDLAAVREW